MTLAKSRGFKVTAASVSIILAVSATVLGISAKFNAVAFQTTEINEHVEQNRTENKEQHVVIEDKLDAVSSDVDRHDEQLKAQAETSKEIKAGIDSILQEQRAVSTNVARLQSDVGYLKAALQ